MADGPGPYRDELRKLIREAKTDIYRLQLRVRDLERELDTSCALLIKM